MAVAVRWAVEYFSWETLAVWAVMLAGKMPVRVNYILDWFTFVFQMDTREIEYCETEHCIKTLNGL